MAVDKDDALNPLKRNGHKIFYVSREKNSLFSPFLVIYFASFLSIDAKNRLETKVIAYDTVCSQAVTHPSTNAAQCCLT